MRRVVIMLIGIVILLMLLFLSHREVIWDNAFGALLGLMTGLLLYEVSLAFDELAKEKTVKENTKYIYELYKIEIEQNLTHVRNLIEKKWIPYYRLQTSTRDNLWGEIADYSKDINLMKKINSLYGEFALINNKIDIMNAVRLQKKIHPYEEKSGVPVPEDVGMLNDEINSQLEGCIGLSKGAIEIAESCLKIIDEHFKKLT